MKSLRCSLDDLGAFADRKPCVSCANRCYFAMFQVAVAALIDEGLQPPEQRWGHDWAQAQFSGRLIKRRKVYPLKLRCYLPEAVTLRHTADYRSRSISKSDATLQLKRAEEFVGAVEERISRKTDRDTR